MMKDYKKWTIPEGNVKSVKDSQGRIIWKKAEAPVEDRLQGTWVFNDDMQAFDPSSATNVSINFISNNIDYTTFTLISVYFSSVPSFSELALDYDDTRTFERHSWTDNNYKTIEIKTKYVDMITSLRPHSNTDVYIDEQQFMEWLEANATKIA